MKKNRIVIYFALVILVALLLSGCEKAETKYLIFTKGAMTEPIYSIPTWVDESTKPETKTENCNVHFVIDSGKSMEGFIERPGTYFNFYLGNIPSICKSNFENTSFESYRLMDSVYEICCPENYYEPAGENYMEAVTGDKFFGTLWYNKYPYYKEINCDTSKTDYLNLLTFAKTELKTDEDVLIFVTDFIPDNFTDPNLYEFNSSLCKDFLNEGYTIGILGIKNYYNGVISGITDGSDAGRYLKIDYRGELPFYIFILGKEGNVMQLIDELGSVAQHIGIKDDEYKIYQANDEFPKNYANGNIYELKWINDEVSQYIEPIENENVISQQIILTDFFENANAYNILPEDMYIEGQNIIQGEIKYTLPYQISKAALLNFTDEWILDIDVEVIAGEQAAPDSSIDDLKDTKIEGLQFPADMRIEEYLYVYAQEEAKIEGRENIAQQLMDYWNGRREAFYRTYSEPEVLRSNTFISLDVSTIEGNVISIPFTIDLEEMNKDIPYCVSLNVSATPTIISRKDSQWIEDWSMSINDINEIKEDHGLYQGGKTLNFEALSNFSSTRVETEAFVSQKTYVFVKSELFASDEKLAEFHDEMEEVIAEQEQAGKEKALQSKTDNTNEGE